eukprot:901329-Rhodomonas_salina.1
MPSPLISLPLRQSCPACRSPLGGMAGADGRCGGRAGAGDAAEGGDVHGDHAADVGAGLCARHQLPSRSQPRRSPPALPAPLLSLCGP